MAETFHDYNGCRITIKQTMKRHKGQRVRTVAYQFHVWTLEGHQYISKKSELLIMGEEALSVAQQIVDTIVETLEKRKQA